MLISLRIFYQPLSREVSEEVRFRVFRLCIRLGQEAIFLVFSLGLVSRLKNMEGKEGLFDIKRLAPPQIIIRPTRPKMLSDNDPSSTPQQTLR